MFNLGTDRTALHQFLSAYSDISLAHSFPGTSLVFYRTSPVSLATNVNSSHEVKG